MKTFSWRHQQRKFQLLDMRKYLKNSSIPISLCSASSREANALKHVYPISKQGMHSRFNLTFKQCYHLCCSLLIFTYRSEHHTVPRHNLTQLQAWLGTHFLFLCTTQCTSLSLCAFSSAESVSIMWAKENRLTPKSFWSCWLFPLRARWPRWLSQLRSHELSIIQRQQTEGSTAGHSHSFCSKVGQQGQLVSFLTFPCVWENTDEHCCH